VPVAKANAFPRDFRLRKSAEFQNVYAKGAKKVSRSFVVFVLPNGLDHSRFGLTTPRKLGKAHDRNRVKRRVREILRTSRTLIPIGFDFVVNPRRSVTDREFEELRAELVPLLGAQR
jgi:ribonuclease P protein component